MGKEALLPLLKYDFLKTVMMMSYISSSNGDGVLEGDVGEVGSAGARLTLEGTRMGSWDHVTM